MLQLFGWIILTRICRRVSRTKYYGKSSYEYVTLWLYLPKKFHETLKPHVNQELNISVKKRNGKIHITLAPKAS